MSHDPDIFGNAITDYYNKQPQGVLIVHSSIAEDDEIALPYLFRSYDDMPQIEQKALDLAKGSILDVGCGAGAHSVYLHEKGFSVTAIDTSAGAIAICKQRGVLNAYELDLLRFRESEFDTIYLLMNGTGIFESLETVSLYLSHLKKILSKNGQVLIDSSDIKYMFEDDEGNFIFDDLEVYYGEVDFQLSYGGETSKVFQWLYMDFEKLKTYADAAGFKCELVTEGPHYDYLARLTHR
ncbi:MAG: methyltransferase domain-containing protein [Leeuwenhoekiella sp.]